MCLSSLGDLSKQLQLTSLTSQQWSATASWAAQLIIPTTTLSAYHPISAVGGLLLQHFLFNLAIDNGEHEKYYKQNQNDPWVQNTTAAAHGYQMMSGRRRMTCSVKTCSPMVMRSVPCSLD